MVKKLALVMMWFFSAPLLLASSIFLLQGSKAKPNDAIGYSQTIDIPQSVQIETKNMEAQVLGVKIEDTRPLLVENFLKNRPLAPYSELMVETADKYDIDWRLIPAIAMKESGGGTGIKGYNAWGFENGRTRFDSWEEAIETVGKTLKKRYIAKGFDTPEEIMAIYAPPQLLTGGQWAKDINLFFSQMESL